MTPMDFIFILMIIALIATVIIFILCLLVDEAEAGIAIAAVSVIFVEGPLFTFWIIFWFISYLFNGG